MAEETHIKPISRVDLRKAVHKHEMKLYGVCVFLNVIIVVVLSVMLVGVIGERAVGWGELQAELTAMYERGIPPNDPAKLELSTYFVEGTIEELTIPAIIILLPIMVFITLYTLYAKTRAKSVRVTEKNFPEIYQKSVEFTHKLGLKKVPEVYIMQGNGVINAFAMAIVGKRIAKLHSEIVDVAYMEENNKDFETVFFVLGHEFAHIYLNHVTIMNNLSIILGRMVPVIGTAMSRAREFSCDRIAQLLIDGDGLPGMFLMNVGRRLYGQVDVNDYLETVKKDGGFFLWYSNLMASHPIVPKRIAALADPERRSGKLSSENRYFINYLGYPFFVLCYLSSIRYEPTGSLECFR